MQHPLSFVRPFLAGLVLAPALARAQSVAAPSLTIDAAPYGAYVGTAIPIRARWTAGGGAPELVDTLVAWRTSDPATAWVGLDGQLYFEHAGRVTVSATRAGVTAEREFDVAAPKADALTIAPMPAGRTSPADGRHSLGAALRAGERSSARDARINYGIGLRGAALRDSVRPRSSLQLDLPGRLALDTAGHFFAPVAGGYTLVAVVGALGASVDVPAAGSGVSPATVPSAIEQGEFVRDIALAPVGDYEAYVGTTIPLAVRFAPDGPTTAGATVFWRSSDDATAWVDVNGGVHFLKRGTVEITASAGRRHASHTFHVRESEAFRVLLRAADAGATAVGDSVRLEADAWVVGGGRLQRARLEYAVATADGAAVAPRVTITEDGVFVAHAPGTYTIMTTINGRASSVVVPVSAAR